jgi:hypothetical protein
MSPEDRDLLHRHLSGDLRGAELEAFFARLKDSPELRRALASFATDEALLSELVLENRHRVPKHRSVRWALVPAAAAALLLAGLVGLLQMPSTPPAGTLRSAEADTVLHRKSRAVKIEPGLALQDGDRITGSADLVLPEGSLTLHGAVVLGEAGSRLDLERGSLKGALPRKVVTRIATVFPSRGSRLAVGFENDRLSATVRSGSARIEKDGQFTDLSAGSYALVGTTVKTSPAESSLTAGAVARGQAFLARRKTDLTRSLRDGKRHAEAPPRTYAELAALALPEDDPLLPELVDAMLGKRIESTYTAALQAVALNHLDAAKHRGRILECYRFLAESQCLNGQWDYGEAQPRRRPSGDNSCSAYAALGLRVCREAGIDVDRELVHRARAWWLQAQNADGGWGYNEYGNLAIEADPRTDAASNSSYGSATASGASSVLILSRLLGEDYRHHSSVRRADEWIGANGALDRNPRKAPGFSHIHYWLALERFGRASEHLGSNYWYEDGAQFLRSRQQADGSWKVEQGDFMGREIGDVLDTCLAVIYLRRVPFSREEQW